VKKGKVQQATTFAKATAAKAGDRHQEEFNRVPHTSSRKL